MAQSRNEYLQSLLRMRENYQSQGNPLINREDDNGNVGNELSAFAYMNTAPEKQVADKDVNALTKGTNVINSVRGTGNALYKGVYNFFDSVGDFIMTVTGAISGVFGGVIGAISGDSFESGFEKGSAWAKEGVEYDWVDQATNFTDLTTGWFLNLLSGDTINTEGKNVGEVFDPLLNNWSTLGTSKASDKRLKNIAESGGVEKITPYFEMAGEMLPAIALSVATFGAVPTGEMTGLQASLVNAGVAGATTAGSSMEKAVKESGKFGAEELGYAGIKGALSFGLSMGASAVGGQLGQNGGFIEKGTSKLASILPNATARTVAKDVLDVVARAGMQVGRTGADLLIDPVVKTLTYDKEAISKAYGDEYWEEFGKTIATTAIIASVSSAVTKIGQIHKEGGWAEHINRTDYNMLASGAQKMDTLRMKMYQELSQVKTPYEAREVMLKYQAKMDKLSHSLANIMKTASDDYNAITGKGEGFIMRSKYSSGDLKKMLTEGSIDKTMYDAVKAFADSKYFHSQFNKMGVYEKNMRFAGENGEYVNVDKNGNATVGVNKDGQNYRVALIETKSGMKFDITSKSDVYNTVQVLSTIKSNEILPTNIEVKPNLFNVPQVGLEKVILTQDVASKLLTGAQGKEITNFLQKGITSGAKNNYVVSKADDKYVVVEPYKDGKTTKYGLITIDTNSNKIINIEVKNEFKPQYTVVPKREVNMFMKTKLENPDGSAKRYIFALDEENDNGLYQVKPAENKSGSFFVYAKNPLRFETVSKQLSFAKVAKKFNIPTSLEKTYSQKMASGDINSVLKFIGRYAEGDVPEVLDKLGFDAVEYKDGKVGIFDPSQLLEGDYRYGEKQGDYDYNSLVKRLGRTSSHEELQRYSGENGRALKTVEDRQKYAQLILDNKAYDSEDYRGHTVLTIKKEAYTKDMLAILDRNTKLGARTKFILSYDNPDLEVASGFYDNNRNIYHIINRGDPRTLTVRNSHELVHYLEDVRHLSAISDILDLIKEWKSANLEEYNHYYDAYDEAYAPLYEHDEGYEVMIINELLAEVYSGNIVLNDSALQNNFVKTIDMVASMSDDEAHAQFVKYIEEQADYKPISAKQVAYTLDGSGGKKASIGIAVTYNLTSHTNGEILKNVEKYKEIAFEKTKDIAKLFNLKINQKGAIGGWTFTDNANSTQLEGEPSFPVEVENYKSIEELKLFASLMADTALEVQNSVGVFDYDENGSDVEDTFYLNKVDENIREILKSSKVEGFTLYDKEKRLVVVGASRDIIDTLLKGLSEGGYLNGRHEATKCNSNWLDTRTRSDIYKVWLENNNSEETRGVRSTIKQAYQINKYIIDNSHLDEQGNLVRNEGILSNASDILNELSKTEKLISDLKAQSSAVLIEAGADVSKDVKYRLKSVKDAFDSALAQLVPEGGKVTLEFSDVKQNFAELNLARPKDRDLAIGNVMKRLSSTIVKFEDGKYKLGDLLSPEQEKEARSIVLNALEGKAEPTKLAKWSKSLNLSRLENQEVRRGVKLMNKVKRKLEASKHLNFGYGDAPTSAELTVFENIVKDLPRFWDNKSVIQFADNILANYNETNIGKLFEDYGITFDENIVSVAELLKSKVVVGQHLSPVTQSIANDLLQLIFNNIQDVNAGVKSANVKLAEQDANITQGMYFGKEHNKPVVSKIKNVVNNFDASVTAPIDFINRKLWGTNLQKFVDEETGVYENKELHYKEKFKTLLKGIFTKKVSKSLKRSFTFKGEKITYGVALDRLNSYRTLGDKFFNSKGAKTNADQTRSEIVYTQEDIEQLREQIPEELLNANEALLKMLNTDLRNVIMALYKECTHTDLPMLDEGNIWYNISRISDSFSGISLGGTSFKDFNLSFLNKRVNSRADINFNLDIQTHVKNYIENAIKRLVWQPYINKLNTLLNTRVYGVTNYKIYQENIPNFDKELDLFVHNIMGVPFERKVSTLSNIAGKAIGNLNAVRVSTIQTGLRTLSSAPFFAKYFGLGTAIKGLGQEIKNGGVLALHKNYKIITANSPYFNNRFSSDEVLIAQTGLSSMNALLKKIFGAPLRFGDAYVHLGLGFAMAQVKAEAEGYGKPYTDENNKRAVWLLEQASKATQPTNSVGHVAGFRYGNGIMKYLVGLYGSMKQQSYDAIASSYEEVAMSKAKLASIENAIKEHDAKINEYTQKAEEFKKQMDDAVEEEEYRQAEKEYEKYNSKAESHKKAKANTEDFAKGFKEHFSARNNLNRFSGKFAGLIFMSLAYVAISNLIKVWEGKKSIKDLTLKDLGKETLEQSFINSMPYFSTLYSSIKNNSDLSIATVDNLNNTIDAFKKFVEAVESGDGGKITGASMKAIGEIANYLGIPLQAMVKIINGTWYNIDKDSNLSFRNWFGSVSGSSLRRNYSDAISKGDMERATANLSVWTYNYSIKTSDEAIKEIARLNKEGYNGVAPSAIPKTYTNEKGEETALTSAQINAFRREYGKADKQVSELLKIEGYKKQDDKTKASMLKRVYSAYRESALAKAVGKAPSGKLAQLIYNVGDVNMAKYIMSLQELSAIEGENRKQNVISAINKMRGYSKQEKLLLAYLSGYSIGENNQMLMVNFLTSKGFTRKDAMSFLNIK